MLLTRRGFWSLAAASFSVLPSNNNNIIRLPGTVSCSLREEQDLAMAASRFRSAVQEQITQYSTLVGPLIRLAFHDATTGYPNGSIRFELDWKENRAISRPLQNVQLLLEQQQQQQKQQFSDENVSTLSLADAIALAGSQAVYASGGPSIPVRLGRVDATRADPYRITPTGKDEEPSNPFSQYKLLQSTMPSPGLNSVGLRAYFQRLGLTEAEFVALSGSHGLGRHVTLLDMPKACLKNLTRTCLEQAPVSVPFVASSADAFDNSYFVYLLKWYRRELDSTQQAAFIPTDVALVVDQGLRRHVERFASHPVLFQQTFGRAYQKLVEQGTTTRQRY